LKRRQASTARRSIRICARNTASPGAGGQDKLKGKIFRIAHLGYADTFDAITAIAGIEMVLKGLGHPVKLGTGVGAAQEI